MTIHLVTFCTDSHEHAALLLRRSAFESFTSKTKFHMWRTEDLASFIEENSELFKLKRGFGNMCWKAYVIHETLKQCNDNDILIYMDADTEIIKPLIDLIPNDKSMYFGYVGEYKTKQYTNGRWTKRDTFTTMNLDTPEIANAFQITSQVQIYKVNEHSKKVIEEFLMYSTNRLAIADIPNELEPQRNYPNFQAHRHDQSILSLLAQKYKEHVQFGRDLSQFGNLDDTSKPQMIQAYGVAPNEERMTTRIPNVTVITPTTGHRLLERGVLSVQSQSYLNVTHLIVIDKPHLETQIKERVQKIYSGRHDIQFLTVPYNTGANRWNGHRIFASIPHLLHKADWLIFLDEDNALKENHIKSLVDLSETNKLNWAYSLRTIVNESLEEVCDDLCESLGHLHSVWNNEKDHLIDTNCYMLSREIAMKTSMIWNRPARPQNQLEPDRELYNVLVKEFPNFDTTKQHTVLYTTGNRPDSVKSSFFLYGNHTMKQRYKDGLPWLKKTEAISLLNTSPLDDNSNELTPLYVAHFNPDATKRFFELQKKIPKESVAYEEWQMTLLQPLAKHYSFKNAYTENVPAGSNVLVHICSPNTLPLKLLMRKDVNRIGYTIEGPNIRHQTQWNTNFLEQFFDVVLTYWTPLLETKTKFKTIWCPFLHRINQSDKHILKKNTEYDKSVCMVLENRHLAGDYSINDVQLKCLDPLRQEFAKVLENLTVYGTGWQDFQGHPSLTVGHTLHRSQDTKKNIDHIKHFTFNLIIENCNADGYVSEKLCDSLVAGAIPLYYGNLNEKMKGLIPKECYIDITGWTPQELQKWIQRQTMRDIIRMKGYINDFREQAIDNLSPEQYPTYVKDATTNVFK